MSDPNPTDPDPQAEAGDDNTTPARFDEALGELETLVETLEQGDLSLDESLAHFERGVGLARECRASLQAAEQRVQILLERDAQETGSDGELGEFESDSDAS